MSKEKLMPLSKVKPEVDEIDSVKSSIARNDRRAFDIIMEAQHYWNNMERFRRERERNKRYTYGDQWNDIINVDGVEMTEEEYIKRQGNIPLKNNLIRRLVRNVLGVYRSQSKEPTCVARDRDEQKIGETMSTVLQYNMQLNRMSEMYARAMEEFLISGIVVHKKWFGWRENKSDCWTDNIQPDFFFVDNNMRDIRGWDCSCVGEIHDISFQSLCGQFAESEEDYNRLAQIYNHVNEVDRISLTCEQFGYPQLNNYNFLFPVDHSKCRVIEVWRKESKPRYRCKDPNDGSLFKIEIEELPKLLEINNSRLQQGREAGMDDKDIPIIQYKWFIDDYWYFYNLSPFGDILSEGETPYEHKQHPYIFKMYPYIDGEIHSFVADVIDQQRYTNRLITLYDWIMRASAKGVLLFPEECLTDSMSIEDVADEWSRFNGVIAIKTKENAKLPEQISNNSTNIGISELLNIQLKFFEDISGVNGALQGKPGYAGMSGSLYSQQTQNATTSLLDILESFSQFIIDAAYKDVKNIQQYYDTKRVVNIAGKIGSQIEYDPNKIRDIEFDLSIVESTSTPAYRQMANEFLMEIWKQGQISLQQLLQNGDFPFADSLLQSLQSQQEQIQQGKIPQGISPQIMQQAQNGANMDSVNKAYQMLMRGNGKQQEVS